MFNADLLNQIRVMQEQEIEDDYRCSDYMIYSNTFSPSDRSALCAWGYQIIADCNGVNRSTVIKAISHFDRFMSTSLQSSILAHTKMRTAQLIFATCIMIALKAENGLNVELDFISSIICQDMYHPDDFFFMESVILRALKWRLYGEYFAPLFSSTRFAPPKHTHSF